MNFKRILVLVMTFAMLISTFAPTLGVFAEELNNGEHNHESNEKNYVSIGDSMANGYGFDGYSQGNNGFDIISNQDKAYGAGAYPLQFEKYLESKGYDVTHTKLAASALRAEDLLYLLGGRETPADDWYGQVELYTGIYDDETLSAFYQNAVKDADIITLGVGNASFGAFFLHHVTGILGVMRDEAAVYEGLTLENALALLENEDDKAKVLEIYNKAYAKLSSYVPADVAEQYHLEAVCDLLAYTSAGFIINYAKAIDKIVELNEKENLEIILVGLMNTTYGMKITLDNGDFIPFGDIMDEVFGLLNAYVAGYPTAKQAAGELQGATFYYAEQPNPLFIVQAFDDLAENGWQNVDEGRLSADIVRARTIKTYNETLRLMISGAMGLNLKSITLENVKAWRSWETIKDELRESMPEIDYYPEQAAFNFMHGDADLTTSVAIYLAIEDAIVKSIAVEDIPLEGLLTIADMNKLLGVFDGIEKDESSPYAVRTAIGNHLSQEHILPLCKIYAIFNIGDGMCVHPTPAGHDNIYAAIVESYENEWTAQKQTIKNAYDYILEYYDEAYEYGYDYVDNAGYINKVVSVLDKVLNRLDKVDLSDNTMTEEFRVLLQKELDVLAETLEKVREALVNDSASDVEGLVALLVASTDDILEHLANIYALCEQAGIDVNQLVIIPALKEALHIIETELIPALNEMVEEFIEAVVDYVTEKAEALYNELLGLSKEAYAQLVAALVRLQLHVEEKVEEIVDAVLDQYFALVDKLTEIYGNVQVALEKAAEIYTNIVNKVLEVKGEIEHALDVAVKVYTALVDKLCEVYGDVEYALEVADKVLAEIAGKLVDLVGDIENTVELAKVVFTTVYDFLVEHGEDIQTAFEIAVKVYTAVVEFVVEHAEEIETAFEIAVEAFEFILEVASVVYETTEEIYAIATDVYATLVKVIVKIHNVVDTTIDVYNYVYDLLVDVFGSVEDAAKVAVKLAGVIVDLVKNSPELLENAYNLYVDIYNIIVEVYGETGDVVKTAEAVYTYAVGVVVAVKEEVAELIYNASNGNYVVTEDSYYVALGNAEYAEELAKMLFLGEKYAQYGLAEDYLADLAKADLVTVKFNNGEFMQFAYAQVVGTLAGIIRDHQNLQSLYNMGFGSYLESSLGFSLDAQTVELEWSKYLDAETEEILCNTLGRMKADLLANGVPEYVDVAPAINEAIKNFVPVGIKGQVNVPVIDLMIFGLESALYAYVEAMDRVATTLETVYAVAPNATVVITGVNNPVAALVPMLEAYSDYIGNTAQYLGYADVLVDVLNANLYGFALVNENTIFVNSDNAADIYEALHVTCAHAYDDCEDTVCNICGEERVAPGHVFGEWVTVKEPTTTEKGLAERTCKVCGCKETKELDKLPVVPDDNGNDDITPPVEDDKNDDEKSGLGAGAIIAIAVGSVAVACGAGALVYWFVIKKKEV